MNNKIIVGLLTVALLLGGFNLFRKPNVVVQTPDGQVQVGALTGPDIPYNYLCIGGICEYRYSQSLVSATGTPCAIRSPSATSTLIRTTFHVNVSTGTAATIRLATSTTPYATTTSYQTFSIPANEQKSLAWYGTSTLATNTSVNGLFAPNTYIVYGAEGSSVGGFTFGGTCTATFQSFAR